jgi:Fe(3+) dicitrate transport protein
MSSYTSAPLLLALLLAASPLLASPAGSVFPPPSPDDAASVAPSGSASDPTGATTTPTSPILFDRLTVTGGPEHVGQVPGSAHYINRQELERLDSTDIGRILRRIPGINIQEEDGYGLRPNIGMRGTGVERSQKITLMEDGVLIAPAPYTAPAAYYFPTPGRMEAIEVRKGSSSIRQGPYTTGGVLNLISTSIPYDFGGKLNIAAGADATRRVHATVGDSGVRFGWMLETFQLATDGFKQLDTGGDTGFKLHDYVGKVRINSSPRSAVQQALELKLGRVTQRGEETYLGLTADDFRTTPFRRYAASESDRIDTEHEQYQLRHFFAPSSRFDLTTTIYRNDFYRNWYKLDSVAGTGIAAILASPHSFASQLAILRGEADTNGAPLVLRHNARDYYGQGVQTVASYRLGNALRHELELGVRYHQDGEDRFQADDRYAMTGGRMILFSTGAPGSQTNRTGNATALAFFIQDQISLGRWTVTPGVRYESIDYTQKNYGTNNPSRDSSQLVVHENSVNVIIPGFSVSWQAAADLALFAGVHRGFAPPGPATNQEVRSEESVNFETGIRYARGLNQLQLVGFFNDYENLLGRDTFSGGGGGSGDLFNGGRAEVRGIEASASSDLAPRFGLGANLPLRASYTYTAAEFKSSFITNFADWRPSVTAGDQIPYLPRHQFSTGIGVNQERWGAYLDLSYTDRMRTRAGQGPILEAESIDSHLLLDVSVDYRILSHLKLFSQVKNLTDETYVAARRPAGLRPGMPRTVMLGLSWDF